MSTDFITLATHTVQNCNIYRNPPTLPEVVHLEDPALDILLDFNYFKPLIIRPEQPISRALELMEHRTLHAMLVVDEHNHFIGVITLEDLMGSKPVQLQERYRMERSELLVKHLMIAKTELLAVDFKDLEPSKVGHVVKTLQELKKHFLLVTEQIQANTAPVLRGLLMDTQISKQLGMPIRT